MDEAEGISRCEDDPLMRIQLRMFVEVTEHDEAQRIATEVAQLLVGVATLVSLRVVQYWKNPEHFEAFLVLDAVDESDDLLRNVVTKLGTGWMIQRARDGEAIWSCGEGRAFDAEHVRWAHVELLK